MTFIATIEFTLPKLWPNLQNGLINSALVPLLSILKKGAKVVFWKYLSDPYTFSAQNPTLTSNFTQSRSQNSFDSYEALHDLASCFLLYPISYHSYSLLCSLHTSYTRFMLILKHNKHIPVSQHLLLSGTLFLNIFV